MREKGKRLSSEKRIPQIWAALGKGSWAELSKKKYPQGRQERRGDSGGALRRRLAVQGKGEYKKNSTKKGVLDPA